jgi:maleylacetoacetate isomerase
MASATAPALTLYSYWRSSAAYRVRIGLGLKRLEYALVPIHLLRGGGEQRGEAYVALNPQRLVPALRHDGRVLTQSLAILDYLDEVWPTPALLPADPAGRARVRALAQLIACDIHPLNNLRVMQYLEQSAGLAAAQRAGWSAHWMHEGFAALEQLLADGPGGRYCHGDTPGLADCCLVPQLYNARRAGLELARYPAILRVEAACLALDAVDAAHPDRQPDAQPG